MPGVPPRPGNEGGRWLAAILAVGLLARIAAAVVAQGYADRIGKPDLFGDTVLYGALARTIVEGTPYRVDQAGIPHYALRTPGYPAFLAGCRALFGPEYLYARLVQAGLGTVGVWLVYRLSRRTLADRGVALVAAGLAAVEPYGVGLGALVLSEGVFIPLMLAGLWGLASLWRGEDGDAGRSGWVAAATGLAHGAAILVRPSWALIVPGLLGALILGSGRGDRRRAVRSALVVAAVVAAVMGPWWARNHRIFGRFVPTAVWVGASLYDGVSPTATGASDMDFLNAPDVVGLDETAQDATLAARAVAFARDDPGRVAWLALVKFGRFWSPWPNAETLRSRPAAVASALVTIPLFALVAIGIWDRRRDPRALVLLAGPLVYFLALHMVFVSSIRYRIPGFLPALGLAAAGWRRIRARGSAPSEGVS